MKYLYVWEDGDVIVIAIADSLPQAIEAIVNNTDYTYDDFDAMRLRGKPPVKIEVIGDNPIVRQVVCTQERCAA